MVVVTGSSSGMLGRGMWPAGEGGEGFGRNDDVGYFVVLGFGMAEVAA